MKLIATHVCKTQNVGFHGNLFGGVMLSVKLRFKDIIHRPFNMDYVMV